ncbi:Ger(x)C family spore germination protein [Paenibacillus sacheonensis]|uniref:Ger(X)C family spore germination protein n=1 Tax=Paenibacillus sacheonensis TaxID=742054 RepID=A0A7X4YPN8_9BACL|nr:Ger(x)C family spore germination protein [Paenibacillus sacheonensis]MBM7564960.1 Ger(x)C family germination protein [Paenibacillus sacheonensis]NBC70252.1 Ger(x)C family spore germination protein [Paenibacillus sacheonensis]
MKHTWMRAVGIAIAVGIAALLGGCWDNRDIDHRSLPVVMGVSLSKDKYEVVLQIPETSSKGVNLRILKQKGRTINQAVDKISERMESSVDLLHLKVILVEKGYAQQGLTDSIASFMRSRDISPKTIVAICDEKLDPFFDYVKKSMTPRGTTLYDCFEKNAGWNPQMSLTRIWEVYRSIHSYTRDVAIPIIKSGRNGTIDYLGSAIIKNGRMVDQITPEETLLFNSFNGHSAQGKIEVMDKASVMILRSSMRHRSKIVQGTPYLYVQITVKVSIVETKGSVTSQSINQELEKILMKRFSGMLRKSQTREADILGLGQYFRNKIPRTQLRVWRESYLPKLRMDFRIKSIIQNDGYTKLS